MADTPTADPDIVVEARGIKQGKPMVQYRRLSLMEEYGLERRSEPEG